MPKIYSWCIYLKLLLKKFDKSTNFLIYIGIQYGCFIINNYLRNKIEEQNNYNLKEINNVILILLALVKKIINEEIKNEAISKSNLSDFKILYIMLNYFKNLILNE